MPEAAALLERIDRCLRELQAIKGEIVALIPPTPVNGAGTEGADFAEHNMASVQAASSRWNVPQDTLRHWCRHEQGLGVRSGNVWRVSVPALRRRLAHRGE